MPLILVRQFTRKVIVKFTDLYIYTVYGSNMGKHTIFKPNVECLSSFISAIAATIGLFYPFDCNR